MLKPAGPTTTAAAIFAAALFVLSASCGGDGDGSSTSSTPESPVDKSPGASASFPNVDLASSADAIRLSGVDPEDLLTGTTSVAAGDFNDDGEKDLLIGAPQGDGPNNERPDSGEAYVVFGPISQARDLDGADVTIFGASAGDALGYSVLGADINADGKDDILVGAPGVTAGFDPRTDQGRLYVFYGGSDIGQNSRLDLSQDVFDFTVTGAEGFSRLGSAMAAGDVNGDGRGDLVVGAPYAGRAPGSPPGSQRTTLGEAYVILGSGDLSGEWNIARGEYDALISGANASGEFASSLAVADVNGDSRADIIAGAHRASAGSPARESSGAVYIFYGREELKSRTSVQDGDQDVFIHGSERATLGYPLTAGDFNGDGTADIALGAQLETANNRQSSGSVHIVFGNDNIPSVIDLATDRADVTISGRETSEFLPSALTATDLDADGSAELVAGSMLVAAADDRFGSGVIYIVSPPKDRGASIDLGSAATLILGQAAGDRLGNAVGAVPVSGGSTAIVALAPLADANNRADSGIVYLVNFKR